MFAQIIAKLKDNKGTVFAFVIIGIMLFILLMYLDLSEMEHNAYIEQEHRLEDALKSASKAAVLQIEKSDSEDDETNYDSIKDAFDKNTADITNNIAIDKNKSNILIERLICDNALLLNPKDVLLLRKHLVLRGFCEPKADGSVIVTMYGPNDYDEDIHPKIVTIPQAALEVMKENIELELNTYLSENPINGKVEQIDVTNTGLKPIPELRIDRPSIILYIQDYPIKTFFKESNLSLYYISPAAVERKIK